MSAGTSDSSVSKKTWLPSSEFPAKEAVKTPFLTAFHDDPGCPSIERENAITEVQFKQGSLVVVTTSDKGGYSEEGATEIAMTKARVCKLGGECESAVVVEANVSRFDTEKEKNVIESTFVTDWTLDGAGAIAVAKAYDAE